MPSYFSRHCIRSGAIRRVHLIDRNVSLAPIHSPIKQQAHYWHAVALGVLPRYEVPKAAKHQNRVRIKKHITPLLLIPTRCICQGFACA